MNYTLKNFEDAAKKAKAKGKQVITPRKDELFIDIDTREQVALFKKRRCELNSIYEIYATRIIPSQTEGHYHIYARLCINVTEEERAFLQLFLGSDPTREYLSMCLINIGDPHPILFFEEPDFDKEKMWKEEKVLDIDRDF